MVALMKMHIQLGVLYILTGCSQKSCYGNFEFNFLIGFMLISSWGVPLQKRACTLNESDMLSHVIKAMRYSACAQMLLQTWLEFKCSPTSHSA